MTASATTDTETSKEKGPFLSTDIISSVKRRLWEETVQGFGNVLGNLGEAWYTGSDAVFYSRERERFRKYIPPFQYGLAATVFLFVNFRITGNPRFQEWRKEIWRRFRSESLPKQTPTTPPPVTGYLEAKRREDVRKALQSMKLLTDGLISLTVGISGALFLLEAKCGKDIRSDYETAPLVAGRSLLADEMCPGMLEAHRSDPNVRKVLVAQAKSERVINELQTGDPTLATFATFIENCQRRENHAARLRDERRSFQSENGPVLIPHTGVR